jgi:hypothetical protein
MTMSFPPNSRYANIAQASFTAPDGRVIPYLAPRIVPAPERFTPLALHRLVAVERVDLLAERYYGDPEQYWRICDANRVFWPPDVTTTPNLQLLIPLPLEVASHGES